MNPVEGRRYFTMAFRGTSGGADRERSRPDGWAARMGTDQPGGIKIGGRPIDLDRIATVKR
jgi:hypothetical protein